MTETWESYTLGFDSLPTEREQFVYINVGIHHPI